ncbi:hypothetical protein ACH5RR_002581 [Cinchona calisaya]|uniref:Uncharacterized protein n=1 Tax=Cinchona calisaya TaxID=153742 RepID=A0ABD3ASE5_9GENT
MGEGDRARGDVGKGDRAEGDLAWQGSSGRRQRLMKKRRREREVEGGQWWMGVGLGKEMMGGYSLYGETRQLYMPRYSWQLFRRECYSIGCHRHSCAAVEMGSAAS